MQQQVVVDKKKQLLDFKKVKDLLDLLNQNFPISEKGIPSTFIEDGKYVTRYVKVDPYFTAYLGKLNCWWICVSDYWIWKDCYELLKDTCQFLKEEYDIEAFPCQIHPVMVKTFYDASHQKDSSVKLFIGKVSWIK